MKTQTNEQTGNCCAGITSPLLQHVLHFLKEWRQQFLGRLTHKSILTLDDKMLKDIGVPKNEIRLASNQPISTSVTTDLEILARRPNHTQ